MILTPLRGPAHPRTGSTRSGARRRATPDPSPLLPEASPRAAGGPAAGPGDSHLPARSPYLVRLQLLHQHLGRDTKDISRPQAAADQGAAPPPTTRGRPPRQGKAQAEGRTDGLGGRAWTETLCSRKGISCVEHKYLTLASSPPSSLSAEAFVRGESTFHMVMWYRGNRSKGKARARWFLKGAHKFIWHNALLHESYLFSMSEV
ncbi:uncharacterized protein LOC119567061 [Chelonia mydas]|uniref:uncharacterized protein LOC119567061 n=1 Tax=Chelonia mydas TaxID=8469 RepID=UPI0018A1CD0E|nr:uncharacterized protein LOC119567061 [Chelonia mydas]